jgi:hypothetical protein
MEDITKENLQQVMSNRDNKFIYFYRGSAINIEEFKKVEEYASKIQNGMRVTPYKVDMEQLYSEFLAYLKERNPKTADQAE